MPVWALAPRSADAIPSAHQNLNDNCLTSEMSKNSLTIKKIFDFMFDNSLTSDVNSDVKIRNFDNFLSFDGMKLLTS